MTFKKSLKGRKETTTNPKRKKEKNKKRIRMSFSPLSFF